MKTLQDIRNEIADLKNEEDKFDMIVFFGGSEYRDGTYLLFQNSKMKDVVKLLDENEDVVKYYTTMELGRVHWYKPKDGKKGYSGF